MPISVSVSREAVPKSSGLASARAKYLAYLRAVLLVIPAPVSIFTTQSRDVSGGGEEFTDTNRAMRQAARTRPLDRDAIFK